MVALLERNLLVVAGKGGVGKTTLAAALGLLAAGRGRHTIVVELGDHGRLPELFGVSAERGGAETALAENLASITIDPDRVLLEWVQQLGGRIPGRVLASSGTFQYFAAAAPGAKELFAMVKVWELTQQRRWQRRAAGYDLVVLDAPATGHALGMLRSPQTFGAIARVGPVAAQAERVDGLLRDPRRSGYVAVAQGTEMAVTETLELRAGLREQLDRDLDAVVVNGLLPRRFSAAELGRIAELDGSGSAGARRTPAHAGSGRASAAQVRRAAAHAAVAVHERARYQHNQVARLRRRDFEVLPVPFLWAAPTDVGALREVAGHLSRHL
jgi:anion-transporting  ArsA/GET3 family ATPase